LRPNGGPLGGGGGRRKNKFAKLPTAAISRVHTPRWTTVITRLAAHIPLLSRDGIFLIFLSMFCSLRHLTHEFHVYSLSIPGASCLPCLRSFFLCMLISVENMACTCCDLDDASRWLGACGAPHPFSTVPPFFWFPKPGGGTRWNAYGGRIWPNQGNVSGWENRITDSKIY